VTPRRLSVTLACLGLLTLPAAALAANKLVPPGNSGASEYYEAVPSANGNTPPPTPASAPPTTPGEVALARLGPHGRAAASLAAAGMPPPRRGAARTPTSGTHGAGTALGSGTRGAGRTPTSGTHGAGPTSTTSTHGARPGPTLTTPASQASSGAHVPVPSGNGPIDSIARALTAPGSGGLGLLLPIFLAGALVAAAGLAVARLMHRDDV